MEEKSYQFKIGDKVLVLDSRHRKETIGMTGVVVAPPLTCSKDCTYVIIDGYGRWGYWTRCLQLVQESLPDERKYLAGLEDIQGV